MRYGPNQYRTGYIYNDSSGELYSKVTAEYADSSRERWSLVAHAPFKPHAPQELTAPAGDIGANTARLTWKHGRFHDRFVIYLRPSDGDWRPHLTVDKDTREAVIENLAASTTYRASVRTYKGLDVWSASGEAEFTTKPESSSVPTGLELADITESSATLSWKDNTTGEDGFRVQGRLQGTTEWSPLAQTGADATEAALSGLNAGGAYEIRVQVFKGGTSGAYERNSGVVALELLPARPAPPSIRISPLCSRFFCYNAMSVSWSYEGPPVTRFRLLRKVEAEDGTVSWAHKRNYTRTSRSNDDYSVPGCRPHTWVVRARNAAGESANSNEVTLTVKERVCPANNLTITANGDTAADLNWTFDGSLSFFTPSGFVVQGRKHGETSWQNMTDALPISSRSASLTDLEANTPYEFRIETSASFFGQVSRTHSNLVTFGPPPPPPPPPTVSMPPPKPTDLAITVRSSTSVRLDWTDAAHEAEHAESGFRVQGRANGESAWETVKDDLLANTESTELTGLVAGGGYDFRVVAWNAQGSAPSDRMSVAMPGPPVAPTGLAGAPTAADGNAAAFTWTDNSHNEDDFTLQGRAAGTTAWVDYARVAANAETATAANLMQGQGYEFRVEAGNSYGERHSAVVALTLPSTLAAPSNMAGAAVTLADGTSSPSAVDLTWTDNSDNETGFRAQGRKAGQSEWLDLGAVLAANTESVRVANLDAGAEYQFRVQARAAMAVANSNRITIDLAGGPPTALAAELPTTDSLSLTWTNQSDDYTGIDVQGRKDGAPAWETVQSLTGGAQNAEATTLAIGADTSSDDVHLETGAIYQLRLQATNAEGSITSASITVNLPDPPVAPQDLVAVASGATTIDLTWTNHASAAEAIGYRVQGRKDGETDFATLAERPPGATTAVLTGLAPEATYRLRLELRTQVGASNELSDTGNEVTVTLPTRAPTDVAVTIPLPTTAKVTWTDNTDDETGFEVRGHVQGSATETWALLASAAAGKTSATLAQLAAGTTYEVRVRAVRAGDEASPHLDSAPPTTFITPPAAPTGLASANISTTSVDLSWTDVENETGYRVMRLTASGHWVQVATADADATSVTVTGLSPGTTYTLVARAYNASGDSPDSAAVGVSTTSSEGPVLAAPQATSGTAATVSWTDHATGEAGFKVQGRVKGGTGWPTLATAEALTGTGSDGTASLTGLALGALYELRIEAWWETSGTVTRRAHSNVRELALPLAAPTQLVSATPTHMAAELAWTDTVNGRHTGYQVVERQSDDTWTDRGMVTAKDARSVSVTGLAQGTEYTFALVATGPSGRSERSNSVTVTTPEVGAPSNLAVTDETGTTATLTWTDQTEDETGFVVQVQYAITSAERSEWADAATAGPLAGNGGTGSVALTGLTAGATHWFRVRAVRDPAEDSLTSAVFGFNLPPAAPTGLAYSNLSTTSVDLSWTDELNQRHHWYRVSRWDPGTSDWTLLNRPGKDVRSFSVTGLERGTTYTFSVEASIFPIAATRSVPLSVTTLENGTPENVAVAVTSSTAATVTWSDESGDETRFEVQGRQKGDAAAGWPRLAQAGANATSASLTGLTAGAEYEIRVQAVRAGGNHLNGPVVGFRLPPAAPSNLASADLAATSVKLSWTDVANETGYRVMRLQADGAWTEHQSLAADATEAVVGGLAEKTSYTFAVVAANAAGDSARSNQVTVDTPWAGAPGAVTVTAKTSATATVTWTDGGVSGATEYLVEGRGQGSSQAWSSLAQVAPGVETASLTGLTAGTAYELRVRAERPGDNDPVSEVLTLALPPPPPTNLASADLAATSVTLSWTDVANETGYRVMRQSGSDWVERKSAPADATSVSVTGLTDGTSYTFVVRATNAGGDSADSNAVTVQTPEPATAGAPADVEISPLSATTATVTWTDNTDDEQRFEVQTRLQGTSAWSVAKSVAADATRADLTGLFAGAAYEARVGALRAAGHLYSAAAEFELVPAAPTGLAYEAVQETTLTLTWTAVPNATGYRVLRQGTDDNGDPLWTEYAGATLSGASASLTGLEKKTTYRFAVVAVNAAGESVRSLAVEVTTQAPPGDVAVASRTSTTATLTWTDHTEDETGFEVRGHAKGAPVGLRWATLAIAAALAGRDTGGSATLTELVVGETYEVRVRALRAAGDLDTATLELTQPPAAPSGVAVAERKATSVKLAWTAVPGATGYGVRTLAADGTWAEASSVFVDGATATVSDLVAGQVYTMAVVAMNAGGASARSDAATFTTPGAGAPADLAVAGRTSTTATLTWTDHADDETGFEVRGHVKGVASGRWSALGSAAADATGATVSGLVAGATYEIFVRALRPGGNLAGPVLDLTLPPAAPTDLEVGIRFDNGMDLSWTDNASNETGFRVMRLDEGASAWVEHATAAADATSKRVTGLAEGTTYTFAVRAFSACCDSENSNTKSATTTASDNATPDILTLSVTGPTTATLTWADRTSDETAFKVQGRVKDSATTDWPDLASLNPDVTSANLTGLTAGATYEVRVRALRPGGDRTSNVSEFTLQQLPSQPQGVTAIPGDGEATLAWTDPANASILKWQFEQSAGGTAQPWADIANSGATTTSHTVTSLANGTAYSFRVRAVNGDGEGPASAPATATPLATPGSLTVAPDATAGGTALDVAWNAVADGTHHYQVRHKVHGGAFEPWGEESGDFRTTGAAELAGLSPGRRYVVEVRACAGADATRCTAPAEKEGATVPAAPASLRAGGIEPTGLTLAWEGVGGHDEARVQVGHSTTTSATAPEESTIESLAGGSTRKALTGLAAGTAYTFFVRRYVPGSVSGELSASAWQSLGVTLPAAAAPGSVTVSGKRSTTATLAWTDNADDETGFEVRGHVKGAATGTWAVLGSAAANATGATVTDLTPLATYEVRVRAVRPAPTPDLDSAVFTLVLPPAAPTLLSGSSPSATSATLTWTDVENDAGYKAMRWDEATSAWVQQGSTTAADATTATVGELERNTSYLFAVRATNAAGDSANSNTRSVATSETGAPRGLAVASRTLDTATLTWEDRTIDETGFEVQGRVKGATTDWPDLATAGALTGRGGTGTVSLTGLTAGATYEVRVRAVRSDPNDPSTDYTINSAVLKLTLGPPAAPANLQASNAMPASVDLAWDDVAHETGYRVVRKLADGTWAGTDTTAAADATSATVTGLAGGTAYTFAVRAFTDDPEDPDDPLNESANSNEVGVTTAPGAPSDVAVSSRTSTTATLTWADHTGDETGFRVQGHVKGAATGTWAVLGSAAADATSATLTGLTAGTTYEVRVRAYKDPDDDVFPLDSAALEVALPPAALTDVAPSGLGETTLTLGWTDGAHETGYRVMRWDAGTSAWVEHATAAEDATSVALTDLAKAAAYRFVVRATNAGGDSADSNEIALTMPAPPAGVAVSGRTTQSATVGWTDRTDDETGFVVQGHVKDSQPEWADLATVGALAGRGTGGSATLAGLTHGAAYRVRVRAVRADGSLDSAALDFTLEAAPLAPMGLQAAAGDTTATLGWTDPSDPDITKWQYDQQSAGDTTESWTDIPGSGAGTTTLALTGLTNGTTYTFRVRAARAGGGGPASEAVAATPLPAPESLAAVDTALGGTQLDVTWGAVAGATHYQVRHKLHKAPAWPAWGEEPGDFVSTNAATVTGLSAGRLYEVEARACAAAAPDRCAGSAKVEGATAQIAPANLRITGTSPSAVSIAWDAFPGSHESVVEVGYNADTGETVPDTGRTDSTLTATGHDFTGLTANATYRFFARSRVKASDASTVLVESAWHSVTATAADPTVPGAPVASTTDGNAEIGVAWSAPASLLPITGYDVQYRTGDPSEPYPEPEPAWSDWPHAGTGRTATITGLAVRDGSGETELNAAYYVRVRAKSGAGTGAWSGNVLAYSSDVPPVSGLAATPGDGTLSLSWTAPSASAFPTGLELFQYLVTYRRADGSGEASVETATGGASSYTIEDLDNGRSYAVAVQAVGRGTSPSRLVASPRVRTAAAPVAPDNAAPVFTSGGAFTVNENVTAVGTVTATDADAEDSVTYAIGADGSGVAFGDGGRFAIDGTSGALTFGTAPDYENPADRADSGDTDGACASPKGAGECDNVYKLTVVATGGTGERALATEQAVTVTVRNVTEAPTNLTATPHASDGTKLGVTWQAPSRASGFTASHY